MVDYPTNNSFQAETNLTSRLTAAKEAVWYRIGVLQTTMCDRERALSAFERVLAVNPNNVRAMTQAGAVLAKKECYHEAIGYLQRAINADDSCGETWAILAHCYVMTDDLQKAYQAYQNALSNLPNPRDPNLWYGIGLLYDRYGSLDNALEAFLAVLSISPDFERADEVCFCIGIIYKEQQKFDEALKYFNRVVVASNPPPPLTRADGWYQIGHVHQLKHDIGAAIEMYKQALKENPQHPKTLQNYGWLEHSHNNNAAEAIHLLRRSAEYEPDDGQTWYLLGRVYMSLREFRQAYDAYQQAVYRDCQNATFWCSIGVLYYQMNQRRDAMDAYTRAIGLNPYVSEVWYDLGTLYESCDQSGDAIDAYRQAARLAPDNSQITARLQVLEANLANQPTASTGQHIQAPQPQLVQMQPDMQNATQGHVNPLHNRPLGPTVHPMRDPLSQQKLSQHQPPTQPSQRHLRQKRPSRSAMNSTQGAMNMQDVRENTSSVEMPPIPSIHPSTMAAPTPNGYSHHQRTSAPAPTSTPVQHAPHPMISAAQPLSQPLSAQQPPSHMLASVPPHVPQQQYGITAQTSAAAPHAQLKPLGHQSSANESQLHSSTQQSHLQLPRLAPPSIHGKLPAESQLRHPAQILEQARNGNSARETHTQQNPLAAHVNGSAEPRTLSPQATMPQLQPLPQIQQLAPLQQPTSVRETHGKGPDGRSPDHVQHEPRSDVVEEGKTAANGGDDNRERFGHSGSPQTGDGMTDKSRPLRVPQLNDDTRNKLSSQAVEPTPPRLHASPREQTQQGSENPTPVSPTSGGPRDRNESVNDKMVIDKDMPKSDTKSIESGAELVRNASGSPKREGDQQQGSSAENGHATPGRSADSKPSPAVEPTTLGPKEDKKGKGEGTKASPSPSLPLPKSNPMSVASQVDNGKRTPAPSTSAALSTGSASIATNRPSLPLLSGCGSLLAAKDSTSSGLGLTSSLTKFSKGNAPTPTTPVNNTVVPSSLPSPLPTRKTPGTSASMLSHRSPHPSKPKHAPTLKSIPIPPSCTGHLDSVPSPSSLPLLPALPSHVIHSEDAKSVIDKERQSVTRQEVPSSNEEETPHVGKGRLASPRRSGDGGSRRKAEHFSGSKSVYGMHRSSPTSKNEQENVEPKAFGKAERIRSPNAPPYEKRGERLRSPTVPGLGRKDVNCSSKREGFSKEDSGRTAKRPRLHEGEKEDCGDLKSARQRTKEPMKGDAPSVQELRSNPQVQDAEYSRSSGQDEENGKPSLSSQMVDLPRLSNPISKSSGPSLAAKTPLPSFRSERMNLSASRSANGSGSSPKQNSQDGNRSSLPFALRSAPVSVPARKSSSNASTRSSGDKPGYHSASQEAVSKRGEDSNEVAPIRKSPRDEKGVERLANGEGMKAKVSAGALDVRTGNELGKKEEKASRAEIRSSAT
eukprot:TRINITY_DN48024_c0_g1_i1.p1 TRINITY_DN48024_c0_g1~~TRINITY_DN48024_c0_g1_i1.p1  ORF type:complete len:1424 (+),score=205.98 TRINITY_DN48024_c0_g1_i1:788-5059(+)